MLLNDNKFKLYILKNYIYVFYLLSFLVPFFIYLRTMNPSSFGWDTTWFHIQVPLLYVGQTTGFPIAFLTGKLFSFIPIGTMAYRLNMYSAFWGAASIFVLFIFITKLLKKEYYIAFITAVFFGLYRVFWLQTTRFEVYTLNTFFTAIIMLVGYYWASTKSNKFLYLYYFLIGLSFTNHPISLFLAPAFIIFPVYVDWHQVFRIKKFFIILVLIISPNLLYLYIPIRSLQGYGNVTTFSRFIDYISGDRYKSDFGFKGFEMLKKMLLDYAGLLKGDFTIVVLIIFIIGLVYLAIRQKKYFILIISLIVLNLVPILFYEKKATHFYLTTMVCFLCVPFAGGLYWIKEGIVIFFNKYLKKFFSNRIKFLQNTKKIDEDKSTPGRLDNKYIIFRAVFLLIFFMAISLFPINLFAANFSKMDMSKETYVYDYWKSILDSMNENSIIISNSLTAHVPIYIDQFETKKNIKIIRNVDLDKFKLIVKENIGKNDIYYTTAYLPDLSQYYSVSKIGERFSQEGFKERFFVYKINSIMIDVEISAEKENYEIDFGNKITISYIIKNNSTTVLNMSSIELKLPKMLKFIEVGPGSDMKSAPGIAKGIYMWTAGPYTVEPGKQYKLSFLCQANAKADGEIEFRITAGNMYAEGPKVKVIVK
ncbi:MAG: DUF2723 domain-containing protein [Actinobacteria bacterium]|nr:DUF2723 domain-containing protein [Actinomycetota bacterium]